jgi:F-type H+-transporting ATPase subunit gamma
MANLKEIRNRIVSVSSTKQITSAMKMVSAAKLKKAQDAITEMRPYSNKLQEILQNVSASLDNSEGIYSEEREVKNVLIVGITSNRGLCGGFNNNVIKIVKSIAADEQKKGANVTVLSIGKKINDAFKNSELAIQGTLLPRHLDSIWDELTYDNSSKIADKLMSQFTDHHQDKIVLVYNQFKNAAVQFITTEQLLPVAKVADDLVADTQTDYILEPSQEDIVTELIPKSIKIQVYKAVLDSHASEHGARMTAMDKATENAGDLIKALKLSYNQARQAAITTELTEIVSGAAALSNG